MSTVVLINPGSGAVEGASEQNAIENIKHYITDVGVEGVSWVRISEKDYGDGRFAFLVWKDNVCHEIQMPGLPLANVRYMDGMNPFEFPRLYVDDSSWLWKFAIDLSFDNDDEN